jgi:hypothetical protein
MNIRRTQTVPQDWDEARDIPFFRVTTGLFSSAFCFGASVLLAGNDDDTEGCTIAVEPRLADAARATAGAVPVHQH